jgi:hypothetical protein
MASTSSVYEAGRPGVMEDSRSGVSWASVLAGASVAAALSFSLMILGAGIGLSTVSPWPTSGLTASRLAPGALAWIALVQALSCALGGYLAGRLRTKWVSTHTHEVFFRDTAHGFLVWAVGLVISVFFLSSLVLSISKDAANGSHEGRGAYYVDSLFRADHPVTDGNDAAVRAEAKEIMAMALLQPGLRPEDKSYLASMVAARTGLTRAEAQARVDATVNAYREAADTARKAVAHSLYWLFAALLIGAFCGSFSATIGGRRRDYVYGAEGSVKSPGRA